jgi:hypothetical protein
MFNDSSVVQAIPVQEKPEVQLANKFWYGFIGLFRSVLAGFLLFGWVFNFLVAPLRGDIKLISLILLGWCAIPVGSKRGSSTIWWACYLGMLIVVLAIMLFTLADRT